jgi:DNA replication protein DnaC
VFEFPTPFDEFGHPGRTKPAVRRGILAIWAQSALRAFSVGALWVATVTAGFLIVRHLLPLITGSELTISLKSGIPLLAIGVSYIILIITLPRTPGQRLVGILMGSAFVLWGAEQFLSDRAVISFMDDVVVFLFVVDLSIVIRQNLRNCAGERLVRKARFPAVKTIDSFNFAAQPSIDEGLIRILLQGEYIERRENVVIVGKSGTGKTHLAVALGYAACLRRKRVFFTTTSALVSELADKYEKRRLSHFYRWLDGLDLLIVDEMGYVRFSELEARLLFEVLRGGYERMSFVITTATPMEKWVEVFGSESLARAVADRLIDRGHLLETTGDPYWKPGRKAGVISQFSPY